MSATTSADVTLLTGTNAPSAQVPYVSEWVQGSTTATYTLVGQVLNNGETNFVGYDQGDALYLLTTSASGASPTTLGDGQSYFYTSGSAPSGYLATDGSGAASPTSSGDESTATSDSSTLIETSATDTGSSTTAESMSPTSEQSTSAQTSQPGAGNRLSVFSLGIGMTLFTAVVFGLMG